jgi:hypothetical protein
MTAPVGSGGVGSVGPSCGVTGFCSFCFSLVGFVDGSPVLDCTVGLGGDAGFDEQPPVIIEPHSSNSGMLLIKQLTKETPLLFATLRLRHDSNLPFSIGLFLYTFALYQGNKGIFSFNRPKISNPLRRWADAHFAFFGCAAFSVSVSGQPTL